MREQKTNTDLREGFDPHAVFADPVEYLRSLGVYAELIETTPERLAPAA